MSYILNDELLRFAEDAQPEVMELLEKIGTIPAPSNHEEKRAAFVKAWLEEQGAEGVYIDDALNVIYPVNCEGRDDLVIFMAHTDVVFPDTTPLPFSRDDKYVYNPGCGDDTASLVLMLMVAKYIAQHKLTPKCGILIVANSGEEGLGNLKGGRQLLKDFAGRISEVYSFDSALGNMVTRCVGSTRYRVTLRTIGGHSYGKFGNPNAIQLLSELICRLYSRPVPVVGDSKTTYNVGTISGGTSVNTIAQNAEMLYEYRSDDRSCLEEMKNRFEGEIKAMQDRGIDVSFEVVGQRPCNGPVDEEHLARMVENVGGIIERYVGRKATMGRGSTDINTFMAAGIPSICLGNRNGIGGHTREEKLEIASLPAGLRVTASLMLGYFFD